MEYGRKLFLFIQDKASCIAKVSVVTLTMEEKMYKT